MFFSEKILQHKIKLFNILSNVLKHFKISSSTFLLNKKNYINCRRKFFEITMFFFIVIINFFYVFKDIFNNIYVQN